MEEKAAVDNMYFASEEPFKFCAIIKQCMDNESRMGEGWTD